MLTSQRRYFPLPFIRICGASGPRQQSGCHIRKNRIPGGNVRYSFTHAFVQVGRSLGSPQTHPTHCPLCTGGGFLRLEGGLMHARAYRSIAWLASVRVELEKAPSGCLGECKHSKGHERHVYGDRVSAYPQRTGRNSNAADTRGSKSGGA